MHLKQFKGQLNSLEELDIYIYIYMPMHIALSIMLGVTLWIG